MKHFSPERSLGAGPGVARSPVFACVCRCEVALLHRRCQQVAGKARLHWALWLWAPTDYYYYYPQGGNQSVQLARWPAAEAEGPEVGGGPCGAVRAGGWGWEREANWRWGHWRARAAPELLKNSVSSGKEDDLILYTICKKLG